MCLKIQHRGGVLRQIQHSALPHAVFVSWHNPHAVFFIQTRGNALIYTYGYSKVLMVGKCTLHFKQMYLYSVLKFKLFSEGDCYIYKKERVLYDPIW